MTDYNKLVEALRYCGNFTEREGCDESCEYFNDMDCPNRIMSDAADAIEALQAELLKRGEWIWIQKENGGQYKGCSVCHAPIPTDSMLDYLDDEDCDFCYSCGAKMGGTE